jgi:hypothetical protein
VTAARALPWTALVEALGDDRLAEIEAALATTRTDPFDRDAVLLDGTVGRLLRDLVPPDAPAEAVTAYGALLHALVLHRAHGREVRSADRERLRTLLAAPPPSAAPAALPVPGDTVAYVQLPERMVWAAPASGDAHEPVDGLFVTVHAARLRVVAVLGFRAEREGFTTVEAEAPLPAAAPGPRPDGAPPFATVLPAGERMGFFSVTSPAELIALALLALAAAAG